MSTRFTAVIKIIKVEPGTGLSVRGPQDAKDKDTELANIVVRNSSLESLLAKTKAHLDLVED